MKIKSIIAIILALLLTSCASFFGYSPTLEEARKSDLANEHYKEYDYLFTAAEDTGVADFLISDNGLIIIKYSHTEYGYKSKSTTKYNSIPSLIQSSAINNTDFLSTGNILGLDPFSVEFIIVPSEPEQTYDGFKSFNFNYNGEECILFYRLIKNKD